MGYLGGSPGIRLLLPEMCDIWVAFLEPTTDFSEPKLPTVMVICDFGMLYLQYKEFPMY